MHCYFHIFTPVFRSVISILGLCAADHDAARKSPGPARDICLRSWLLWLVGGLIALGYGAWCLHDFKFCMVTFLSTVPIAVVLLVVFYNRHIRPAAASTSTI